MSWRDLHSETEVSTWKGLEIQFRGALARPQLHMQAASQRIMRLMAGRWPLLWARVAPDRYGYWYLRLPVAPQSPGLVVPPISAMEARAATEPHGTAVWMRYWARDFARKLQDSTLRPLYSGRWWLMPAQVYYGDGGWVPTGVAGRSMAAVCHLSRLAEQASSGYADWDFGDSLEPLALRPLSSPASARVKAWRRALHEGVMPPALLMWISGLDRYVVLDGHDRIAAALAEGSKPPVLALCPMVEALRIPNSNRAQAVTEQVTRKLQLGQQAHPSSRTFTVHDANRLLIETFDDRPELHPISRAWPMVGGIHLWRSQVADALQGTQNDELRAGMLDDL